MNSEPVSLIYRMNSFTFTKNLEGISNEESLKEIQNANSINWIAGHIVVTRNSMFKEAGLDEFADERMVEIYKRGSELSDKAKAFDLEEIKKLFNDSQARIIEEIPHLTDPKKLEEFAFFSFHESYHIGQIGIVRKLIGKEGAIK